MFRIKTGFRVICILGFIQILLMGASASDMMFLNTTAHNGDYLHAAGATEPTARLQIHGVEENVTNNDTIMAGMYLLQYTNSITTLVTSSNTTISNIT
jgi:hypothetical protein